MNSLLIHEIFNQNHIQTDIHQNKHNRICKNKHIKIRKGDKTSEYRLLVKVEGSIDILVITQTNCRETNHNSI